MLMIKNLPVLLKYVILTVMCAAAAVAGWRVDSLVLKDRADALILRVPLGIGQSFTTTYIHSVELTPVEDEYFAISGKIWQWQERVKSSNAGMPCFKPDHGMFIRTDSWLIFQGGRKPSDRFFLRVGNEKFGKNRLIIHPFRPSPIYKLLPGERLTVEAVKEPLVFSEKFESKPMEALINSKSNNESHTCHPLIRCTSR